jgi:hypothetical protein
MVKGILLFPLVLVLAGWFILKPGAFFVPPTAYEPEGVILLYHNKTSGMPFFASPESLCKAQYGTITTACLETGEDTTTNLSQRLITRLPYADWAYQLFLPQK